METIGPIACTLSVDFVQNKLKAPSRGDIEALLPRALSLAEARAAAGFGLWFPGRSSRVTSARQRDR